MTIIPAVSVPDDILSTPIDADAKYAFILLVCFTTALTVPSLTTIDLVSVLHANFDNAIAAVELIFASSIVVFAILPVVTDKSSSFAVVTESDPNFAAVTAKSFILAVVTAESIIFAVIIAFEVMSPATIEFDKANFEYAIAAEPPTSASTIRDEVRAAPSTPPE